MASVSGCVESSAPAETTTVRRPGTGVADSQGGHGTFSSGQCKTLAGGGLGLGRRRRRLLGRLRSGFFNLAIRPEPSIPAAAPPSSSTADFPGQTSM
jgi:hypothetical protein